MTTRRRPFLALAGALTRAAGPPALLRAVPPFAVIGVASTILFAGYGMNARDLVGVMGASLPARLALWAAWILVTAPAARALLETPSTFGLRSLPVPPWHFWLVHAAHLVALEGPWIVLFTRGGGPVAGLAEGIAAAAAGALWVARPERPLEIAAAAALAAVVVAGAPPIVLLPAAMVAGWIGIAAAWTRAPERSARRGALLVAGSAPVALALAHLAVLGRREPVALLRGAAAALVGAAALALAIRNNGVADRATQETIALAAGAMPLALATGGPGVKILETERRLEWLLLTTAASVRLRALTAAAVSALWGAAAGALYGAGAALAAGGEASAALRLLLLGSALGASLGAAAAHWSRRAERASGVDGTAASVGMIGSTIAAAALSGWLGALAVAPLSIAALALALSTVRLLERREERRDHASAPPWVDA